MVETTQTNKSIVTEALKRSSTVLSKLAEQAGKIAGIADVLLEAYQRGNKMVLFGNGGSAADAQHLAAEMVCAYANRKRKSLPALALTTDTSALTAIGNDFGFEHVFSRQVESLVNPGDVVIAISTSGHSPNVLRGAEAARTKKAVVVGLTGESGGPLKDICDYCVCVPAKETARIQEGHIAVGHILCSIIEQAAV
ncbi:MAG: D-sedoheptulose 7-phosphate isomerase [Elusimicrobia bacterium]|nr:D-sedoheptulose 7-phosphate isomerase [Candidatus Obscuribacterium magneticum]